MKNTIDSIPAGESWGCVYTVVAWLDSSGTPILTPRNLQPGQSHPGVPGEYTGFGILQTRDRDRQLLELWDPQLERSVVVDYASTSEWDTIEWRDP